MKNEQYASLEIKIMIMDALLLEILSNADIKSSIRSVYALVIFMNNATKLFNYFIILRMLGLRITSNLRHIRKATEDKTDILWYFWHSTALQRYLNLNIKSCKSVL